MRSERKLIELVGELRKIISDIREGKYPQNKRKEEK